MATLTYAYADSTAVLGPLSPFDEPHTYDLCADHANRMTVPRGWEVVRLGPDPDPPTKTRDDLEALADAVREAARPAPGQGNGAQVGARRGHLRALPGLPS